MNPALQSFLWYTWAKGLIFFSAEKKALFLIEQHAFEAN